MPRFLSSLTIGAASAFLVVGTAAFSLSTITGSAFAIGVATLLVSVASSTVTVATSRLHEPRARPPR
jgi:hypothetical protein